MTAAKPARTLRLTATTPSLTYVTVTDGKKSECYRLDIGYACVRWVHTGDASRGGIVTVNGAGKATGCDCKAALYGKACKHRSGTEVMIARGLIEVPAVAEATAAAAGVPESWMHTTEGE